MESKGMRVSFVAHLGFKSPGVGRCHQIQPFPPLRFNVDAQNDAGDRFSKTILFFFFGICVMFFGVDLFLCSSFR